MIRQSIARRYAKALFAVGEKDGRYKEYLEQMGQLLKVVYTDARGSRRR